MIDSNNNLIINGYLITNNEGNVMVDSEGCPLQFLTHEDAEKVLKVLESEGVKARIESTILTIPEG